jgi:D-alanyl-D-alanine carboxypeptidase
VAVLFREPIIDFLPIDQGGWSTNEYGSCYLDEDGDPVSGWQEIEGVFYYFHPDTRALHTGWVEHGNARHYVSDGQLCTGWTETPEGRFFLKEDGSIYTGWLEQDGKRMYLNSEGFPATGWTETAEGLYYMDAEGIPCTGLVETDKGAYCFADDGTPHSGWYQQDGKRYFANADGSLHTGWLEQDGKLYYLTEAGAARGKYTVDGTDYFFTSTGENIIVVNPWNYIPQGYEPELVNIYGRYGQVDASCAEELNRMLADCAAAGGMPDIAAAYRTHETQEKLHTRMLADYVSMGYSEDEAFAVVKQISAVPGTSEHQLGLAVDIVDSVYTKMDTGQLLTTTQIWLVEHCWEYGFILRYPRDATRWTGIVYEPWHYRYVGTELALELRDLGICLEEYLYNLTEE